MSLIKTELVSCTHRVHSKIGCVDDILLMTLKCAMYISSKFRTFCDLRCEIAMYFKGISEWSLCNVRWYCTHTANFGLFAMYDVDVQCTASIKSIIYNLLLPVTVTLIKSKS